MGDFTHADAIEVRCWGRRVGAIVMDPGQGAYAFEYAPAWLKRGIELAPLMMPVDGATHPFIFPSLNRETYKGLPGLIADVLPDDFGSALIDAYMAGHGVDKRAITSLDRLAYMGKRGMGALEFHPAQAAQRDYPGALEMASLVRVARDVVRGTISDDKESHDALSSIIRVGTSAGGARAKAVVALNLRTKELRSGQFKVPAGFEHWLIKFDGIGPDIELGESNSYGRIEFAYYTMARAAGIDMSPSEILEENGRRHFMTKRFDRDGNAKHHVQTLCGMAHVDFKLRGTNSYSQLFQVIDQLGLGVEAKQQTFRRMAFNVAGRNCDDHAKNHSFLLREGGQWELAPAYDIVFAYNPKGEWTYQHLMSVNGKWIDIRRSDLLKVADVHGVPHAVEILAGVNAAIAQWSDFAEAAAVPASDIARIQEHLTKV